MKEVTPIQPDVDTTEDEAQSTEDPAIVRLKTAKRYQLEKAGERASTERQYQVQIDSAKIFFNNSRIETETAKRIVARAIDEIAVALKSETAGTRIFHQLAEAEQVLHEARASIDTIDSYRSPAQDTLTSIESNRLPVQQFRSSVEGMRSAVAVASANSKIATEALASADRAVMPIFVWIGVFYSLVVIFPWALFLLFIYRKRNDRADQIAEDLRRLDPNEHLLARARGVEIPSGPVRRTAGAAATSTRTLSELSCQPGPLASSSMS